MLKIVTSSTCWFILCLIVFILFLFFGGFSFINCKDAFKGYVKLFEVENNKNKGDKVVKNKLAWRNLLFFTLFPFILATACNLNQLVQEKVINVICVVTSILTTMLFSFMAVINAKYESVRNNKEVSSSTYERISIINKETADIVTCEVLISIFVLILCFAQPLVVSADYEFFRYKYFYCSLVSSISWLIYFNFFLFIINLLIVAKRFYRISSEDPK